MCDLPEVTYWSIGNQEWRLQVLFHEEQKKVLKAFKEWSPVGTGINKEEKKEIRIFSKKFKKDSELKIFILDLEKKYKVLTKEV